MPRRAKGLTAAFVDKAAKPERYADGGGLYLEVRSKTAKFWEAHFTLRGKRRSMGGGSATGPNAIGLAQARIWNRQTQTVAREGRDPIAERKAEKAKRDADDEKARAEAITFTQVADIVHRRPRSRMAQPPASRSNGARLSTATFCRRLALCRWARSIPALWRKSSSRYGARKPKPRRGRGGALRRFSITPRRAAGARAKTRPAGAATSTNSCLHDPRCSASSITRRSIGARSARSWQRSARSTASPPAALENT